MKRWPPLNSLRGFEAVARLGSFYRAAEQLHVTQSAISHQIRGLEAYLGMPLFYRMGRKVVLTDPGRDFLHTVRQMLQQLNVGIGRLEQFSKPNQLIINTTSAFAGMWLLPRLERFYQEQPDVDVWLFSTDAPASFENLELHLSLRNDVLPTNDLVFELIYQDALSPMAVERFDQVAKPDELVQMPLLHGEQKEDWPWWFAGVGVHVDVPTRGTNFSDAGLSIQAAVAGLGVVLGSRLLSFDLRQSGQLRALFPEQGMVLNNGQPLLALYKADAPESGRVSTFISWLKKEIGIMQDADSI